MLYITLFCLIFIHGCDLLSLWLNKKLQRIAREVQMRQTAREWHPFEPILTCSKDKVDWKKDGF